MRSYRIDGLLLVALVWLIPCSAQAHHSNVEKAGLSKSTFAVGNRVKAAGYVLRRRAAMQVNNMLLPNGEEALFYPDSRLRWSDKAAGGQWARESVSDERRGLYRIWSVADVGAYLATARAVTFKLTPQAQAKMAA